MRTSRNPSGLGLATVLAGALMFAFSALTPLAQTYYGGERRGYDRYGYDRYGSDRYEGAERDRGTQVEFTKQLIDMEATGAQLARAGLRGAEHNDLNDYLRNLEANLSDRARQLQDRLEDRYGIDYRARFNSDFRHLYNVLREPDLRGDEFEIRLLKTMIDHHYAEVRMIRRNLPYLESDRLRETAEHVLDRRTQDARRLRYWLKDWYDISYTSNYESRNYGDR